MKTRKGEQPLVMMRMEVMTRMIVVVIAVAVIVDMMMMTTTPIVRVTTAEIMIACTMIGVNSLVIEKMKTQIFSMKNMMMMWTTMMKILKMMTKLTGGVTLIVTNTG